MRNVSKYNSKLLNPTFFQFLPKFNFLVLSAANRMHIDQLR